MMTKDNNNNNNSPLTWTKVEYSQAIPVNNILNWLPPELRHEIEKDLKIGKKNIDKSQTIIHEKEKIKYDFNMVNANTDLKDLVRKLKKSKVKNYGILLYGEAGVGKSYLAEYIAQELHMPFLKKRASDLLGKFVGETEANTANAFKEANKNKALLVFDEADSFLFDRKYAKQEFNVSSVNEVLTQMETHPYPFVMTTNLKEKLDPASMRRFIFKIKFDYMKPEHIQAGVKTYFGKKYKLSEEQLNQLSYLTAGDFKVAKRKIEILEDDKYNNEMIFKYLLAEQNEKNIDKPSSSIKF